MATDPGPQRFAVVSDVPLAFRPANQGCDAAAVSDPEARLAFIMTAAREWDADVVFNLGDRNARSLHEARGRQTVEAFRESPGETISVIGTHDADNRHRETYTMVLGMPLTYFSTAVNGWTVLVLDSATPRSQPAPTPRTGRRHSSSGCARNSRPPPVMRDSRTQRAGRRLSRRRDLRGDQTNHRADERRGRVPESQCVPRGHDHRTVAFREAGVDSVLVNSASYRWDADGDPAHCGLGVLEADPGQRLEGTGRPDN